MKLLKNKKKGFTLVEILLVVGFIALAGIGIYTVYSKVQNSNAALTESKNLDTLRAGVKNLYGGNSNYAGISNSILNDARITPDSMRKIPYQQGDSAINNSFGGSVTVNAGDAGGGTNNIFYFVYKNVPGSVCAKLITGAGAGWDHIVVNSGTVVKQFGTGRLDVGALSSACAQDSGSGVEILLGSL